MLSLVGPNMSPLHNGPLCHTNTDVCTFSTSHNRLYHEIETVSHMCTHNPSIYHPQAGRLAMHWQGCVPLRCTLVKDKASKQNGQQCRNTETSRTRGSMPTPAGGDAERGRERLNAERWRIGDVRIIQQQLDGLPREGVQGRVKWRKSNKPLFLYFSFITCLSAIVESIHNGESKQISLSPIRKGITFIHFLRQRKLKLDENVSGSKNFFDESMSDWKRIFCVPVKCSWCRARFAHGKHQNNQSLMTNIIPENSGMFLLFFILNVVTLKYHCQMCSHCQKQTE